MLAETACNLLYARVLTAQLDNPDIVLEKHVVPWLVLPGDVVTHALVISEGTREVRNAVLGDVVPGASENLDAGDAA